MVRSTYFKANEADQSKADGPNQPKPGESAKVVSDKVQVRVYGEQEQHQVCTLASCLLPLASLQQVLPEASSLG